MLAHEFSRAQDAYAQACHVATLHEAPLLMGVLHRKRGALDQAEHTLRRTLETCQSSAISTASTTQAANMC